MEGSGGRALGSVAVCSAPVEEVLALRARAPAGLGSLSSTSHSCRRPSRGEERFAPRRGHPGWRAVQPALCLAVESTVRERDSGLAWGLRDTAARPRPGLSRCQALSLPGSLLCSWLRP